MNPEHTASSLLERIDRNRIEHCIRYLAQDPLPCRRLNYTVPGRDKCTLYEADDFIRGELRNCGYPIEETAVEVQAFGRDVTKPLAHQYTGPNPSDPWYTAYNLCAKKTGIVAPEEVVVVVAHKDSQSWMDCGPGAYDNASGTAAALEIARVLSEYPSHRSLGFLFCNEEHTPWTSVVAAQELAASSLKTVAALNLDSLGGKSEEDIRAGIKTCSTRFTTPEGEVIADLMGRLNYERGIGLTHRKYRCERPNDDDGSFVNAGIPAAVMVVGSFPYADPNYHTENDTFANVDIQNVYLSAQLALTTVLHLDRHGVNTGYLS
ncbi:MAG: M28 family peptidase [Candidatus Hydrogenedentes bacterium]|nr:M28 family peptidase [Candidatus Hydrogenedentota bacterium]